MRKQKQGPIIVQSRLQKLQELIALLSKGHWSVAQLAKRFDTTPSTIYRYLQMLETDEMYVEKDFQDCYYLVKTNSADETRLTVEEQKYLQKILRTSPRAVLKVPVMKKLGLEHEPDEVPVIFQRNELGNFVEQIMKSIRGRFQVLLKEYHSPSSNVISDRLIEPIHFGDNYQTIVALDTKDQHVKQFKLDRIGSMIVKRTRFKHEKQHTKMVSDIFGFTGTLKTTITLRLSLRAWLLLREEFPLAIPYMKKENDHYIFKGPVSNYDGIARFALGLMHEVTVLEPMEFRDYLMKRIKENVL